MFIQLNPYYLTKKKNVQTITYIKYKKEKEKLVGWAYKVTVISAS
jgi:hypothetical protein